MTEPFRYRAEPITLDVNVFLHMLERNADFGVPARNLVCGTLADPRFAPQTSLHVLRNVGRALERARVPDPMITETVGELTQLMATQAPIRDPQVTIADYCVDVEDQSILALGRETGSIAIITHDYEHLIPLERHNGMVITDARTFNGLARQSLGTARRGPEGQRISERLDRMVNRTQEALGGQRLSEASGRRSSEPAH